MQTLSMVLLLVSVWGASSAVAQTYPERFVWIFGYSLGNDQQTDRIVELLEQAASYGYNGAVISSGMDRLSRQSDEYFRNLERVKRVCEQKGMDLIPSIFSVGYGGSALSHNPNLAEGFPVRDAPFLVSGEQARLIPDPDIGIQNGDFERFEGNRLADYRFHDQPGEVSFVDTEIRHSGSTSLRFENFDANPHGHGRVMQEVTLKPYRCYRMSIWVRTENLGPSGSFRMMVLAGQRDLDPRRFDIPATTDWRKVTMLFNSLDFEQVRLYAGVWGARHGKFWLDDWTLEEVGPLNVLHRPGTPVRVTSSDGLTAYVEGRDYAPLEDPAFHFRNVDRPSVPLRILPNSAIRDGQRLRVSWYHPMVVGDSQITVCMGEPELYEIWEREAEALWRHLRFRRVLLSMDEIRMGGTDEACRDRNMGELLGECITRQVEILRRFNPDVEVLIWSDMLDPNHNAHGDYYLVQGDFTGSWNHVPRDLVIAVWGGAPREKSLRFFEKEGFRSLIACYYDAPDLKSSEAWLRLARSVKGVQGFMYTTWRRKYDLLGDFGRLIWSNPEASKAPTAPATGK